MAPVIDSCTSKSASESKNQGADHRFLFRDAASIGVLAGGLVLCGTPIVALCFFVENRVLDAFGGTLACSMVVLISWALFKWALFVYREGYLAPLIRVIVFGGRCFFGQVMKHSFSGIHVRPPLLYGFGVVMLLIYPIPILAGIIFGAALLKKVALGLSVMVVGALFFMSRK